MKWKREFEIAFVSLKLGEHHFNYFIEDSFFEHFAIPDFKNAQIEVHLTLDKTADAFLLYFKINGKVLTHCDRCGDPFTLELWDEFDHVVKWVDELEVEAKNEEDAEVTYISKSESLLDVSTLIYENIIFSLPIQKVHPNLDNGESGCNQETLSRLKQQITHTTNKMWDELKNKIKNE